MKRKILKSTAMSLATITVLSSGATALANAEIGQVNQNLKSSIEVNYNIEDNFQVESGEISLNELDKIAREYISKDKSLSVSEKKSKLKELDKIHEEVYSTTASNSSETSYSSKASTSSFLGISYVKPGPGRIRIYLSPSAIKIALVVGVGGYVASIISTLGLTGAPAFVISSLVMAIIDSGAATKSGATLHGWDNYKSWNFRLGNTLQG